MIFPNLWVIFTMFYQSPGLNCSLFVTFFYIEMMPSAQNHSIKHLLYLFHPSWYPCGNILSKPVWCDKLGLYACIDKTHLSQWVDLRGSKGNHNIHSLLTADKPIATCRLYQCQDEMKRCWRGVGGHKYGGFGQLIPISDTHVYWCTGHDDGIVSGPGCTLM